MTKSPERVSLVNRVLHRQGITSARLRRLAAVAAKYKKYFQMLSFSLFDKAECMLKPQVITGIACKIPGFKNPLSTQKPVTAGDRVNKHLVRVRLPEEALYLINKVLPVTLEQIYRN